MNSHSEKMLQAIAQDDLAEAQLQFEQALRSDAPEILAQLAEQLQGAGFLVEAEAIFKQLLTSELADDAFTIALAEIAIEQDEIEEAFDYLESISLNSPNYVESLLVLADLYQVIGVPEVSEKKIKEAKDLLPDEPILDLALAELYFASDKLLAAIPLYQGLVANHNDLSAEIDLNERLGSALSMSGAFEESLPYLEAALAAEQTDQGLFLLGVTYIQLGEREKAIAYLQQLRLLNPEFEALYLPLASALLDEHLHEEAEVVMAQGLSQNPYALDLYHLASDNAFRLGKTAVAEEYIRKAIALEEDKEFSLIKLANLLLAEARYDDVLDTLASLSNSEQGVVHWNLAQAYDGLEQFVQAKQAYEKAYLSLQHEPDFLKDYGLFLRAEGQNKAANEILSHYLQHVPGDLDIYNLLEE